MDATERSAVTAASWERMAAGEGYLYAVRLPDGMIKIGFAFDPSKRARELKGQIVAAVRGTRAQEHALHRDLGPFRIANYGGRPDAREFYVPAVLTYGPVPEDMKRGVQLHPEPRPKKNGRPKRHNDAKVIELHAGGALTLQQIGDAIGITRERVRQILVRNGIDARRGHVGTPAEVLQARTESYTRALERGLTTREALASIGLTYREVRVAAATLGVKLPKAVRHVRRRYKEVAEYYAAHKHLTGTDVAAHFNVSSAFVSRALELMGVRSRQAGWKWDRNAAAQLGSAA